ncbi:MAG TPA: ATP-binding protein [Gemmatimonadales bacterium]|nr:ATP-binding protein [Gemmatimonadales bacterium]
MTPTLITETLPGSRRGRVSAFQPRTVAMGLALGIAIFAFMFDRWDQRTAVEFARGAAVGRLSPRRVALQNRTAEGFSLLPGLAALLAVNWGEADMDARFDHYAAQLRLGDASMVRSLQSLQDGVITHVWPMTGNAAALGRDLHADPTPGIWSDYLRAADHLGPPVALSGPVSLYQGGTGLIGRLRADVSESGTVVVVAAVLDLEAVIRASGLTDTTSVRWLLRDQDGRRIAGESDRALSGLDPVTLPVLLPDRIWRLDAVPVEGWAAMTADRALTRRLALVLIVGLAGLSGYLFQSRLRTRIETESLRDLRAVEEQFALLFQLVPDGVALIRISDDRYLQVNDAYCAVSGRSRDDFVGHDVRSTGVWAALDDRARAVELVRETGALVDYPFRIRRPDGSERETLVSCRVIELDGVPHYLSVVRDVHERVALERRLVASQRLEAIGRLAGGVAHDFNNLVTAIGGYAGLALDDLPEGDPRRNDILEIKRASSRAADLTRQLLTFARRQVVLPQRVDLGELVMRLVPFLERIVGEGVSIEVDRADAVIPVLVDPSQLEHALVNLIVNARDAMGGVGTVTIRTGLRELHPVLEVHDTGVGIPATALPHIFEPFYTTKPLGQGTGLGLATVYGIIEQAGGTIEVESDPGHGTTLRFVLPPAGDGAMARADVGGGELPAGDEHILVVDDEPQIRDICSRVLGRLGYAVSAAAEGMEALGFLESAPTTPIALVLSDLVMPGMGGIALRDALAVAHPELPVVLMSGYSEDTMVLAIGEVPFLPKPFTAGELAAIVRKVLDARGEGRRYPADAGPDRFRDDRSPRSTP